MPNGSPSWLKRLFRAQKPTRPLRRAPRAALGMEALEERDVPATIITVVNGAVGAGTLDSFLSATDGTINATDALGTAGSVSVGALQQVGAGIQISITAEQSILFNNTTAANLLTTTANSAQFIALNGDITFGAATNAVNTAGGDLTFAVNSGVLTLGSLNTNSAGTAGLGGNIALLADRITIPTGATVNAGTSTTRSIVSARPITDTINIDLGGADVLNTTLGLDAAELGRITAARILRVGGPTITGTITVTAAITLGANVPTLSLIGGATITDTGAGSLSVANLRAAAANGVTLDNNAANDVDTLSLTATAAGADIVYGDVDGFVIGLVDSGTGISTSAAAGTSVTLAAGGAVTQATGANVVTNELELLGAGSFNLSNQGNNAVSLAASLSTASTGTLTYVDADALSVNVAVATTGITTNNASVTIATVNGDLTVVDTASAIDLNAGTGTVSLTAASSGNDRVLAVAAGASVTGTGGITLVADNITTGVGASVNAGAGTAALRPFEAGTLIDLGGADGANTLGLSDAELDVVTAAVIVIGRNDMGNAAGNISISAAIDTANTNQLELVTGGSITGAGSITETRLGLTAATGIGTSGTPLATSVSNAEGTTATGGIFLANTGAALTVGGVNGTLTGLSVTGTPASAVVVTNNANITASEAVSNASGGDVTLTATGGTSDVAVNAAVSATGGNGGVSLSAGQNITVAAAVSTVGTGTIAATTLTGTFTVSAAGSLATQGGGITVSANTATVGGPVTVTGPGNIVFTAGLNSDTTFTNQAAISSTGGNVTIRYDRQSFQAGSSVTVAANREVNLRVNTGGFGIDLGSAVDNTANMMELSQAELSTFTAGQLRLTSADNVNISQSIVLTQVATLVLEAVGGVTDGTAGEQADLTVTNLALKTSTGIGTADDLDVAVTNLAGRNTTSGNVIVSNTGALTVARNVFDQSGVTNNAVGGQITIGAASPMTIDAPVAATGGGDINLFTSGATGDLTITVNGSVVASGGNGNISLDTSAATSGGQIAVNNNTGVGAEVSAAGTGTIGLFATGGVALNTGALVQALTGNVTVESNTDNAGAANANGTANITLAANSRISTDASVVIDADPDNNGVGGGITMDPTAAINGNANPAAVNVSLSAAQDITAASVLATTNLTIDTNANILDDGSDTTFVQGNVIALTAGGRVGGTNVIQVSDVFSTTTAEFRAALDFDFAGATPSLAVTQGVAGGNVQLRKVNTGLTLGGPGGATLNLTNARVGAVNQFALISSGGNLSLNTIIAPPTNLDALIATTGGGDIVFGAAPNAGQFVNGTAGATTTVVASGTGADIVGATNDNNPEVSGSTVRLHTTGGLIGTTAVPVEINAVRLDGSTNGNGAAAGADAFITDVANGVALGQFNAGTAGDFTLHSIGNSGSGTNITAVTPNDNVAEVIADVVTLDVTGVAGAVVTAPSSGATGQIGSFSGTAQFVEVNANTINAATNNSRLWLSEVGTGGTAGAAVGLITAGTENAILRVRNGGALTSAAGDAGTADVVGATVILTSLEGGSFGAAGSPLEIDATTLTATADTTGLVNVTDTAGGLTVQNATSGSGNITVTTTGAGVGLVLGNGSSTGASVITTTGGTVTLTAPGAITSAASTGLDVSGGSLALTAGTGLGTTGTPLETAVTTIAGTSPTGGIFVTNTGALTVGTVGAVTGITAATSGNITVAANSPLTVAQNVTGTALVNLTAGDSAAAGDDLTISATRTVSTTDTTANAVTLTGGDAVVINGTVTTGAGGTVNVFVDQGAIDVGTGGTVAVAAGASVTGATLLNIVGGADADTFNLRNLAGVSADLDGGAGSDTLNVDLTGATTRTLAIDGVNSGVLLLTSPTDIDYTAVEFVNATNGTYALTLNLATAGFQNASAQPDVTTAAAGGTNGVNLSLTVGDNGGAPVAVFGGENADVSTLTLTGSTDRDTFVLNLGAGSLPTASVAGNAPTTAPGDTLTLTTGGAVTGTVFTPGGTGAGSFTFANRNAITFTGIETLPAPIVSVVATDPNAAETGVNETPNTGTFTFTRVGDVSAALTVNFTVGGTAVAGRDFQTLGTTVTFAAGSATATVTVTPINNSIIDGTRTVLLTLAAGTGYTVGAGATATVSIADNDRPVRRFAVGSSAGGAVQVFDDATQVPVFSFLPYAGYTGGVSVAVADLTGDGVLDIITGATELSSHVKAFDGTTGAEILSIFAFPGFNAGVGVAGGDLDGDGRAEIIVGALTSFPHVKAFSASGNEITSFFAYTNSAGAPVANLGVSVAAGDFNGDGRAEILVGSRSQAGHVKTFDLLGNAVSQTRSFLAPQLAPGITVGAGDLDGDGIAEILVGGVGNGQNTALVMNPTTLAVQRTVQQGTAGAAPVVAAADLNGDGREELLLSLGSQIGLFGGTNFDQLAILNPFVGFRGNLFVG